MTYNSKIHRRKTTRLQTWDYSWGGWYYVTICTHHRHCILGKIVRDAMELNGIGRIVEEKWLNTPNVRPNIGLDDYVIMPNHLHGLLFFRIPLRSVGGSFSTSLPPAFTHSPTPLLRFLIRYPTYLLAHRLTCSYLVLLIGGNHENTISSSPAFATRKGHVRHGADGRNRHANVVLDFP